MLSLHLVLILPLLAIIVAVIVILRRRPGMFVFRGPRKRHIITRIICGALGVGILIALTVGTLHAVNKTYAPSAFPAVTAHVPTLPPPTQPGSMKKRRVLVQLLVLDTSNFLPQVRQVKEMQMDWLEGQETRGEIITAEGPTSAKLEIRIMNIYPYREVTEGGVKLPMVDVTFSVDRRKGGVMRMGTNGWYWKEPVDLGEMEDLSEDFNSDPLTLLAPSSPRLYGLAIMRLLADDDRLREISADDLLGKHKLNEPENDFGKKSQRELKHQHSMPAMGLAGVAHIGLATISLLAATILLTQLFTRRTLVFAAVMAVVILYAAAMDRAVLSMNVTHLNDQAAPLAVRTAACRQTAMSFFYGKTALREIQAVASDPSAPPALKKCADQTARVLLN